MKKILQTIVLTTATALAGCSRSFPSPDSFEIFKGEIKNYTVRIEDENYDNYTRRLVFLEQKEDGTKPFAITGHDYDGDNKWDRIFIRETSSHGCNAVKLETDGSATWDPCPGDKDRVKEFTPEQISNAREKLDSAMNKVHDAKYSIRKRETKK